MHKNAARKILMYYNLFLHLSTLTLILIYCICDKLIVFFLLIILGFIIQVNLQ